MMISFVLNCLIVAMVAFALYAMFSGWDFMRKENALSSIGLDIFRFFTIDSNVLMGICALVVAIAQLQVLTGKASEVSTIIYAIKLMGTSAVMLTFLVTVFFLVPQFEKPMILFYNSNLFFHLVVPLVSLLSFVLFEREANLPLSYSLLGALPTVIYAIYYISSIFKHLKNGQVDRKYDFYNFLNGKKEAAPIAASIVILISYLISLLIWFMN